MDTMVSRTLSVHQKRELLLKFEQAGLDSQLAQRVIESKDNVLASRIVQQIMDDARQSVPARVARLVTTLTVTCHGNATASQLVQRGKYTWSNDWITDEHFPIPPHDPATYELELFQFDHDPSWGEVLAERTRRNLNEPTYEQGLYLDIQHPEEQRQHPVVITHDPVRVARGRPRVLLLFGGADDRKLDLLCTDRRWFRDYVFVGVRKLA